MSLSERLRTIVSLVPLGASLADVGSDHAAVPLALLEDGTVAFCQAIDNKKGPYERMKKAVESSPYKEKCLVSLSDGLSQADPRIDTAVLAGLGGELISLLLKRDLPSHPAIKAIIVDPHSERPSVYRTLMELSFKEDRSVSLKEDGIYYEVSRWVKVTTAPVYDPLELSFNPLLVHEKPTPWRAHWEGEAQRLEAISASLADGENERKKQISERLVLIREVLK